MKSIILLLVAALGIHAQAGFWSSGGGNGVVCRDADGQINEAYLLDLYEWEDLDNIVPVGSSESYEVQAEKASFALAHGVTPADEVDQAHFIVATTKRLIQDKKLIRSQLPLNEDSNHFIVPYGCEIEAIARFQLATNKLFINNEIWQALSDTHKAALIVHESYYAFVRIYGENNSERVRRAVALAFAGHTFKYNLGKVNIPGDYICTNVEEDGDESFMLGYSFYFRKGSGRTTELVFQFLDGLHTLEETVVVIQGLPDPSVDRGVYIQAPVNSKIEYGKTIMLRIQADKDNYIGEIGLFNGTANALETKFLCQQTKQ